nr:MAG TPA: hypothetical protein [Caudoviricetes sp.]
MYSYKLKQKPVQPYQDTQPAPIKKKKGKYIVACIWNGEKHEI